MTDKPEDKKKVVSIRKDLKVELPVDKTIEKKADPKMVEELKNILAKVEAGGITEMFCLLIKDGDDPKETYIERIFLGEPSYPQFMYCELQNCADDYREEYIRQPNISLFLEDE